MRWNPLHDASGTGPIPDGPYVVTYEPGPLRLLAQVRMSDVADFDVENLLPHEGWLLFFYAVDAQPWGLYPAYERTALQVLYVEPTAESLVRTVAPEANVSDAPLVGRPARLVGGWELPDLGDERVPDVGRDEQDYALWSDLQVRIRGGRPQRPLHHLLGAPEIVQNPMQTGVAGDLDALWGPPARLDQPGDGEPVLLLQIDSDDDLGWMWGDIGRIYFWIRRGDLRARRFEATWFVLQC